jgi:hypothetical protein
VPLAARVVNAPVDLIVAPIGILFMEPPVRVALLEDKLFTVAAPSTETVSNADPILIVSAVVLSVAILSVLPAVPVPMLTVLELLPVPKFTVPEVPESIFMAFAPVELIVASFAKTKEVGETRIVFIEATPVKAPAVVILSPPFEINENVPVALPIAVLPVPVVAILTLDAPTVARLVIPSEDSVVNAPVDAPSVPIAVS